METYFHFYPVGSTRSIDPSYQYYQAEEVLKTEKEHLIALFKYQPRDYIPISNFVLRVFCLDNSLSAGAGQKFQDQSGNLLRV